MLAYATEGQYPVFEYPDELTRICEADSLFKHAEE
jgi:hypothetical protein